jgi:hypothetical protein
MRIAIQIQANKINARAFKDTWEGANEDVSRNRGYVSLGASTTAT